MSESMALFSDDQPSFQGRFLWWMKTRRAVPQPIRQLMLRNPYERVTDMIDQEHQLMPESGEGITNDHVGVHTELDLQLSSRNL